MDLKGIINFTDNKNRIHRKLIHAKDQTRKINLHNNFKSDQNQLDKIAKSSKARCY